MKTVDQLGNPPRAFWKALINRTLSIFVLAGGVVLLISGLSATKSFAPDASKYFTGSATDRAVWMLIGGTVATLVGLMWTLRSWKEV